MAVCLADWGEHFVVSVFRAFDGLRHNKMAEKFRKIVEKLITHKMFCRLG